MAHIRARAGVAAGAVASASRSPSPRPPAVGRSRADRDQDLRRRLSTRLRGVAEQMRRELADVPSLVDLRVEKQVLIPQISVRIDYRKAAQAGPHPGRGDPDPAGADRRRARRARSSTAAGATSWCCACPTSGAARRTWRACCSTRRPGAFPSPASRRSRRPTGRTRSAARTAAAASSSTPTPMAPTWRSVIADIRAVIARTAAADRQVRQPGRPVPGPGAGDAADRRAVAGVAGDDVPGALFALSVRGPGRRS